MFGRRPPRPPHPPRPVVEALEAKLLYSADLGLSAFIPHVDPSTLAGSAASQTVSLATTPSTQAATHPTAELVFVDASVPDIDTLLRDFSQQASQGRAIEVIVIRPDEDGITRITQALQDRHDIAALHLIGHGESGDMQLGATRLDPHTLLTRAADIAGWQTALSPDADLLLYGCDVAAGTPGHQLVDALAALTGADVAASDDRTGASSLGGDWNLEVQTGHIDAAMALSASAQAEWTGVLALAVPSTKGTAIWTESGFTTPQQGAWDGYTLGSQTATGGTTASWTVMSSASSPTRNETIAVGTDASGNIKGEIWNGSTWSALPLGTLSTGASGTQQGFAVAYEQQSGDAMLLWNDGTTLRYSVYNGTSWSASQTISAYAGARPVTMRLAAQPHGDGMVLSVTDSSYDDYALIWDGSSWGHAITLDKSGWLAYDQDTTAVAYESQSGRAMVAYNKFSTSVNVYYRIFDGSTWSAETAATGYGETGLGHWLTLASDPGSNRIALGLSALLSSSTSNNTTTYTMQDSFAVWDGSAWGARSTQSSFSDTTLPTKALAVGFESQSGDLLAVYGTAASTTRYLTWTRSGGWSNVATGPNTGQPGTIDLFTDPYTNHVMMGVQAQSGAVSFTDWTGSAWGSINSVATASGSTQTQALSWIWANDVSGNKVNTLLVGGASAGTNWSGVNTVGIGEVLEFADPNLNYGGTTTGTFSHIVDFAALGATGGVDDIAWVSQDVTLAAGLTLHRGDVLLTTTASSTLTNADGSTLSASNNDLVVFRPTVAGHYDKGTFTKILSGLGTGLLGLGLTGSPNIRGLALVEQNTTVGDVTLTAGTILFTAGTTTDAATIARFVPDGGLLGGLLSGNVSTFITGSQIGIGQAITGLEVVSKTTPLKNVTLNAGSLLITLEAADTIASNNLSATIADVITLVPTTTSVNTTAAATATLLMRGSSVGASGKVLDTLALSMDAVPTISSNGGGAVATVNLSEGLSNVDTLVGTDADTDTTLTYSITGGDDAALFQIDARTGALRFITAPDFESPTDGGLDNHYIVAVQASDGTYVDSQVLTVVVSNVNEAPVITSNGGGQYASLSVVEGGTAATQVLAVDPDGNTLSFTLGGTDAALFNIDSSTGVVTFKNPTDFTNPADSNADNLYEITVQASDAGALSDTQNLVIRVLQSGATANATPVIDSDLGGNTAAIAINEGLTAVTTVHATDADTSTLTYGISGGTDQALFDINPLTGALSLRSPQAFATRLDADADGVYEVTVSVSDGATSDTQDISVTVLGYNQPPVNTLPAIFDTSEDTVLPLSGLSVTDSDAGGSAIMVVTLTVQHGTLSVLNSVTNGVTSGQISYSADHRQVTLTASLDAINATLADALGVSYLGDAEYNGSDTLTMSSDDQGSNGVAHAPPQTTDTDTATINVSVVDDAPTIVTSGTLLPYTENAGATVIDSGITLGDNDSSNLSGATIQITGNAAPLEDVLAFTDQNGITGTWDAANSQLVLSGTATLANYQAALRSVTYRNTSDNPSTATRTVTFSVSDASSTTDATRQISIAAVNDGPSLSSTAGALAYTENDAATAIDAGLTLTDPDDATFSGATVQISNHYIMGEDELGFTDQNGITGTWVASTGTLTLSGSASLADYQAALRSITYRNTTDNPSTATRTVAFSISDAATANAGTTRDVTVAAVNDAPVLTTSNTPLTYTENDAATAIDPALTLADPDNATFNGATVQISNHYLIGEDVLSFTNQNGITGTWDASTGTLTLSGSASLANYQAALRSVTYRNTSDNPGTATRTVTFGLADAASAATSATRDITIAAVNDAPALTTSNTTLAYTENEVATAIDAGLTLTDPDNATFNGATVQITGHYTSGQDVLGFTDQNGITGTWDASTGTLTLSGNASLANYQAALRSVTYRNTSDNPGTATRTVTFGLADAASAATSATRDITVAAVNDAPVLTTSNTTLAYSENDAATAIDPALTLADPDNATFNSATVQISNHYLIGEDVLSFTNQNSITGTWDASTGTLTLSGNASLANYQAALRSVTYRNTSDNPGTATRTVTFGLADAALASTSATRDITIAAVNDAPVLTTSNTTLAYTENDAATVIDPALTLADSDNATFNGATVQITGHYADDQDILDFSSQNGITGTWDASTGTLTLSGSASLANYQAALRSVTYRNTSDNPGTATRTVTFGLADAASAATSATRDITVAAVNDAPVLTTSNTPLTYTENDAATAIDPALTLADPDNATFNGATVQISNHYLIGEDVLSFTNQNGITGTWDANTGTLTLSGSASLASYQAALRSVTYRNTSDNPGTATRTVTFGLADAALASTSATRDITIAAVNDAPVLTTSNTSLAYTENDDRTAIDPALNIVDPDNSIFTGATIQITGHYTAGQDALRFVDQNGITGTWDASTGTLTLSGNASLADYQAALRSVTYDNSSEAPDPATRTVTFSLADTASATTSAVRDIAITAVNDAPVLTTSNTSLAYAENDAATAIDPSLTLSDLDNASFTGATIQITGHYADDQDILDFSSHSGITGTWDASTGTLTLSGNASLANYQAALRSVTYRNTSDNPGTATRTVTFGLADAALASTSATRDITVAAVNDAPVLTTSNTLLAYTENDDSTPIDIGLTLADPDNAGFNTATIRISGHYTAGEDELGFTNQNGITSSWDASTGTLTLSGNASTADYQTALRSVTYRNLSDTPDGATRTITFTLADASSAGASATRAIAINPADDAPSLALNTLSLRQGDTAQPRIEVQDIDTAPSGLLLTATHIAGGRFINQANGQTVTQFQYSDVLAGRIAFVQDGGFNPPSYALTVQDGHTASTPQTVQAQFTLLPPPPVPTPTNTASDTSTDTSDTTPTASEPAPSPAAEPSPVATSQEAAAAIATAPTPTAVPVAFFGADLTRAAGFQFERPQVNIGISKTNADITIRNSNGATDIAPAMLMQEGFQFGWTNQLQIGTNAEELRRNLDALHDQLDEHSVERRHVVASSIALSTGLSVGYVIWLVRGGALLGSMLSAMPAWQMIDPLPVLTRSRRGGPDDDADGEDGSVEHLFDGDDDGDAGSASSPHAYQDDNAAIDDDARAVEPRP